MRRAARNIVVSLLALVVVCPGHAQNTEVTAQVVVAPEHGKPRRTGNDNVVLWITPLDKPAPPPADPAHFQVVQKNKQFYPHVLPVQVGTAVQFPNDDPYFHNVFSLYRGERFDLGLYEAGKSRIVRFDRPGVSFIFCNIHPGMSAYVLALDTPYFGVSDGRGRVTIPNVPPGRYHLQVWYERATSGQLAALARQVVLPGDASLGTIRIPEARVAIFLHTDKHGQAYYPDRTPYPY